ncbi:glycosyltransferase family 39 protein [Corallococcus interemptor]|uniref:glycosyltransferase family 39 protein n=1 Tax=Corallococcus interemptor TaxID=2316720 RepID=UPI003D0127EF
MSIPSMTPPVPVTERLDGFLVRHRRRVLGGLLFLAVFLRAMVGMELAGGPLLHIHEQNTASDNYFFAGWAQHLADGDWLQREPLHPMTAWMRRVAGQVMRAHPTYPVELGLAKDTAYDPKTMAVSLWDRWLGGPTYFQEPLYPYLVALTRVVFGPDGAFVFAWQLALGVLGLFLVYRLGRVLFSETVGVVGAVLGLLYAPLVVHEFVLLRDSLIVLFTLALLAALVAALERGGWRWTLFGALSGLAVLVKVPFVIFLFLALAGAVASRRCRAGDVGRVFAGLAVALLPAVARNALVGVPWLKFNGSGTSMLAYYHMADSRPYQFSIGPGYADILFKTDGRFLPALREAIQTHASLWGFIRLSLAKVLYSLHGSEVPNNVDVALFRQAAGTVRAMPLPFWALGVLGAVGTVATRARWRQLWPLYVGVVAALPTLVLASFISRYRLPLAAALLPLAGAGFVALLRWGEARRWRALGLTAVLAVPYVAWASRPLLDFGADSPAAYYQGQGTMALRAGWPDFAELNFRESLRWEPGRAQAHLGLGDSLLQQGLVEDALPELRVAADGMTSGEPLLLLGRALLATGKRDEGLAALREAVAREPAGSTIRQQSEQLLSLPGGP